MPGEKRIERLAPELDAIISTSEPIHDLAEGFGGPQGPAEGPLWWHESGHLVFSDIHNNRRMKYTPGAGVTLLQEPTNRANGLTRDLKGRLLACEHDSRRVTRQELDGDITVIVNSFQGRQLNRPNDVVVKSDGCIYFTDPWTSPAAPEQWDLTFSGVYRVTPDLASMTLLIADFIVPNGLAFSPDESVLYVVESRSAPRTIHAFDVLDNGRRLGEPRLLIDAGPGTPDGFRVDIHGNLWCGWGMGDAELDGVRVFTPQGEAIGHIDLPERCANVCFGGRHRNRLFMAASHGLYSLYVNTQGVKGG